MRWPRTFATLVAAAAGGVAARRAYRGLARFEISEASMVPVLRPGDRILTWEREPSRSDIVVFEHPSRPDFWMVKRVIGLPGEHVEITDGRVLTDGAPLDEPWTTDPTGPDASWDLDPNEAIVLGDARSLSAGDSRQIGPVPIENLRRVVVARYWPDPRMIP
ncbi:MAG: signal peptidase I [Acidimicrobiia bacterium]